MTIGQCRGESGVAQPMQQDVTAFVLSGGQSTRMGRDKAMLPFQGSTLLERALGLARQVAPRVGILASRARYAAMGAWIVEDEFPDCGPLGGIHAALGATRSDLNVILSVDVPFLPVAFMTYLLERARTCPEVAVVAARSGHVVQSTSLACRRSFRRVCEEQLRRGRYRVEDAIKAAAPLYLEEEELRARGFGPDIFRNLNTPEDLAAAQVEIPS
ncbi:MAG TPA: molybdenum cofactor guanylyltransferase [Terriglobia bacterium]|nr:molybdenum cofactor guanylyltransferase [Terriglobia bacterium]